MGDEVEKDVTAAPKKAAVVKASKRKGGGVAVNNTSTRIINTSKGSIAPGESGYATEQECRSLQKWLEKA